MTSGEHTKGAWRFVPSHVSEGDAEVRHHDGWLICCTPSDELAQLIVTAVNTYPAVAELVNALEGMIGTASVACDVIDDGTHRIDCTKKEWDAHVSATKAARSALAHFREAQAGGGE